MIRPRGAERAKTIKENLSLVAGYIEGQKEFLPMAPQIRTQDSLLPAFGNHAAFLHTKSINREKIPDISFHLYQVLFGHKIPTLREGGVRW